MLILKGDTQKSVLISNIMAESNSVCFTYDTQEARIFDEIFTDSDTCSLVDYVQTIAKYMKENATVKYDNIIFCTNKTENEVQPLIAEFESGYDDFAEIIIIACR